MENIILIIVGVAIIIGVLSIVQRFNRRALLARTQLSTVDNMTGHEFEEYLTVLFSELGYQAKKTKGSSDFGVDLILKKDGAIIAIQAKRYRQKVNLQAVQEVVAGRTYYGATEAWVITNSYYTDSARELARPNQVKLIDRNELIHLIKSASHANQRTIST